MAGELKELLEVLADLIGKMPDTALYILAGVFIFKISIYLATTGGIYGIARLLINKIHDAKTKEKTIKHSYTLDDDFIIHDGTYENFKKFLKGYIEEKQVIHSTLKKPSPVSHTDSIHKQDVIFIKCAVMDALKKISRE